MNHPASAETFKDALQKPTVPDSLGNVELFAGNGLLIGTARPATWYRWATLLRIPALAFGAAAVVFALDARASMIATLVLTGATGLLAWGAFSFSERGRAWPRFVLHTETSMLRLEARGGAPILIPFAEVRSVDVESAKAARRLSVRHGESLRVTMIDCVPPAEWETLERVQRLFEGILHTGEITTAASTSVDATTAPNTEPRDTFL